MLWGWIWKNFIIVIILPREETRCPCCCRDKGSLRTEQDTRLRSLLLLLLMLRRRNTPRDSYTHAQYVPTIYKCSFISALSLSPLRSFSIRRALEIIHRGRLTPAQVMPALWTCLSITGAFKYLMNLVPMDINNWSFSGGLFGGSQLSCSHCVFKIDGRRRIVVTFTENFQ